MPHYSHRWVGFKSIPRYGWKIYIHYVVIVPPFLFVKTIVFHHFCWLNLQIFPFFHGRIPICHHFCTIQTWLTHVKAPFLLLSRHFSPSVLVVDDARPWSIVTTSWKPASAYLDHCTRPLGATKLNQGDTRRFHPGIPWLFKGREKLGVLLDSYWISRVGKAIPRQVL